MGRRCLFSNVGKKVWMCTKCEKTCFSKKHTNCTATQSDTTSSARDGAQATVLSTHNQNIHLQPSNGGAESDIRAESSEIRTVPVLGRENRPVQQRRRPQATPADGILRANNENTSTTNASRVQRRRRQVTQVKNVFCRTWDEHSESITK